MCREYLKISLILVSILLVINSAQNHNKKHKHQSASANDYADAVNQFALSFFKNYPEGTTGNIVFSPISMLSVLDISYMGTKTNSTSYNDLKKVLGYTDRFKDDAEAHKCLKDTYKQLTSLREDKKLQFSFDNVVMNKKDEFHLYPSFKEEVAKYHEVKFEEFNSTFGLDEKINKYVADKTNRMITKVLEPTDVVGTILILLNTAYFKAEWRTKFQKSETTKKIFHNNGSDNEKKSTDFMRLTNTVLHHDFTIDNEVKLPCTAISLDFSIKDGQELDMIFILPNERKGLPSLIKELDINKLAKIYAKLTRKLKVHIEIPKFDFLVDSPAQQILEKIALRGYFSKPDLSKMGSGTPLRKIPKFIHKARIIVNEAGAEASAVSVNLIHTLSLIKKKRKLSFVADHPFIFIIRHKKTNLPLFIGKVNQLK